jgi:hypothetical protein
MRAPTRECAALAHGLIICTCCPQVRMPRSPVLRARMLLRDVQFWLCGRCRCRHIECSVRMRTYSVLRTVCPLLSTHRHDNLCTSFCSPHHTRTTQRCSKWIEARASSSQRGRAIQRLEKLESWPHRPALLWPRGLGTWPPRAQK